MFIDDLEQYNMNPKNYLKIAKTYAKNNNYNPNSLSFSLKPNFKLQYQHNDKTIYFGAPQNKDFIIYQHLENNNEVEKGTAEKHRKNYLKRATAILGNWKNNKYSKNNLAIHILWAG
jgi:hypothetical protein